MAQDFPRMTTLKQPMLVHVANTSKSRYTAAGDTVFMCLATRILPEKFDHPIFRKWLAKHTDINGCIPTLLGNVPKVNVVRLNDSMQDVLTEKFKGKHVSILLDDYTDSRGVVVLATLVWSCSLKFCVDVQFLESHGPNNGVERKEVAQAVLLFVSRVGILPTQIHFVWFDEGSVCITAFKHALSIMWPNAVLFLC